jgi:preprotein translocase subunit SecG
MQITDLLDIITVITAVFMVLFILLQARGASLGAGFGSSGELYTTRRGLDKNLHEATIILTIVFVLSIIAGLLIG